MKKFLLAAFMIISVPALAQKVPANPNFYSFPITKVVDGDTVEFEAKFLPPELKQKLKVRIYGVDTPEKAPRALCEREAAWGKAATDFTKKAIMASQQRHVVIYDWDKYGGRVLGDVYLDGVSLRALLIQNGYAREYFGDKKKSWCE